VPSVVVTLWIVNRPTAECESAQDESAENDANHLPIDRQHNCHHIIARVQLQHSWRIGFACRSESIGLYRNDSVKACSSHTGNEHFSLEQQEQNVNDSVFVTLHITYQNEHAC